MAGEFNVIEYMSGLTGFVLDESVLVRIAQEREVDGIAEFSLLTERDRDLLLADILCTVVMSPSNIPSFQHQHGQFSMSIGQQVIKDKDELIRMMLRLYRKWDDPKAELFAETSNMFWNI